MKSRVTYGVIAFIICALLVGCSESEKPRIPSSIVTSTSSDSVSDADSARNADIDDDAESSDNEESADDNSDESEVSSGNESVENDEPSDSDSAPSSTEGNSTSSSISTRSTPSSTSTKTTPSSTASTSTSSSSSTKSTSSSTSTSSTSSSTTKSTSSSSTTSSTKSEQTEPTPTVDKSSLITDYTRKWAYNTLTDKQKQVYALFFECVSNGLYEFKLPDSLINVGVTPSDVEKTYWAFDYDNAQFIELGNGYGYQYTSNDPNKVTNIQVQGVRTDASYSQFTGAANNILNNAYKQSSGYEQLKYIHDWIVNNTVYILNGPNSKSEADGPIVNGAALCEGYSKAFMYLAQSLGYECVCVKGYANGGGHMWNMVKLDGVWYHVDVTWDDPIMNDGSNYLRYDYFLVSENTIRKDHNIDNWFTLPSAPSDYRR